MIFLPDVTTVPRLAELFGISTDELLGVARAPEEPRKSHVGEVVDEVVRDAEESGFHMDWQGSGIWFALFLILTGVTYLLPYIGSWRRGCGPFCGPMRC